MALDPQALISTLQQLSAPGYNRAIGSGDVVPYQGPQNQQGAGGAGAAMPGASYDPNAMPGAGATSPAGGGGSFLNNLSALTPLLNQIFQAEQAAGIQSGQGNMMANPLQGAAPGPGSQDIGQQIAANAGGVPIAGSGGVRGIGGAPTSAGEGASGPAASSGVGAGAAAAGVAGATGVGGVGDSGPAPAGAPAGIGDTGAGGVGAPGSASSSGVGPGTGTAPGDASDAGAAAAGPGGAGAGAGDGGSTVICTELRRQGYLDENVWIADTAFGQMQSPATRAGYILWAAPIARGMARSRVLTLVVAALAIPWAVEMAYQMGVRKHGSLIGRAIMAIGLPLCTYLGGSYVVKTGS